MPFGIFSCFSSADFSKLTFFKKFFQEYYQSVKQFGSGPSVGPDLGSTDYKICHWHAKINQRGFCKGFWQGTTQEAVIQTL